MTDFPAFIVRAARSVVGPGPVQLHAPDIGARERAYVDDALSAGWVAAGPHIEQFESRLCELVGRKYAVAVSSGTAALHLSTIASGVVKDTVVECPSLTFVATANAIRYCNGMPFFTDLPGSEVATPPSRPHSAVKETRKIVTTQLLGRVQTGNIDIEDACQALGSPGAGRQGSISCFSFNGNKICTAGGGGAVLTDDSELSNRIRHLATQAKGALQGEHDAVGFNYRMPNINAALGLAQLERLPEFLERKATLRDRYAKAFAEQGIELLPTGNNWLNSIRVPKEHRDETVKALNAAGYESRALHTPLHLLPVYAGFPREDMSRAEAMWNTTICLPSGSAIA